jgi:hypothetical protein
MLLIVSAEPALMLSAFYVVHNEIALSLLSLYFLSINVQDGLTSHILLGTIKQDLPNLQVFSPINNLCDSGN